MLGPLHLIHHPVVTAAGLQRDLRSRRQFFQKLPEYLQIMSHAKRRPVFTLLIDRGEYRKLLVRITSDKMFHKPLQLLSSWGSAMLLYCRTLLQRFHRITIFESGFAVRTSVGLALT